MSRSIPAVGTPAGPTTSTDRCTRAVRESSVLVCVSVCTVLVVGFVACVNLAAPALAASSLHPSSSQLLWIVDAYVVFFACLVIPAGALGDRYGRKGVLTSGLVIFAAGAAISAAAGGVPVMLAGRAITGVGAACVLPNGLAVLIHATAAHRRSHAIAIWAAMSGVGGVVGNVGGGAVLEVGSWRWLFAAAAPVALVCAGWVTASAPRSARHDRPIDAGAAALLMSAMLALLLGIIQGPEQGWGSAVVVGAFVAATVLVAAWLLAGLRSAHPVLDPRLLRLPALRASCLGMIVVFFGMFGLFFLNASLLQYSRGFSVVLTGLAVAPMTVPMLVGARYVPALVTRVGRRGVLGVAFATVGIALFGLGTAVGSGYVVYAAWLVLIGIGMTLALPALTMAIAAALPRTQAGVAGGLQATTREFGSALGVAVIGSVLTGQFVHRLSHAGGARTVAEALHTMPSRHRAVVGAYTSSAGTALKVVAVIVLVTGALVLAEMSRTARRSPTRSPAR